MFKWIYLLNALITVFSLLYYFETSLNKVNKNYLFLFIFITVSNYAYALSVFSDNFEGTYIAMQIYYATSIFADILMFLIICNLYKYKPKVILRMFLFFLAVFILVLYATIKSSNLYYTSMEFTKIYGLSIIARTYGPLHFLLLFLLSFTEIYSFCIVLINTLNKNTFSRIVSTILLIMLSVGTAIYILAEVFKVQIEVLPFIFTIIDISLLIIFKRIELYDISANLLNIYEQGLNCGYVVFDNKFRYLTANDFAKETFPIINTFKVDSKVPETEKFFKEEIIPWIRECIKGEKIDKKITVNNKTLMLSLDKTLSKRGKTTSYLITLLDITQNQKYIDLINDYNGQLELDLAKKTEKLSTIQRSIITGMAMMVESRDNSTGGHIKRTSESVKIFVEKLKTKPMFSNLMTPHFCESIIKAAPMHDLGKIAVKDEILRKPGKFTEEEYEEMKKHPAEGAKIVAEVLKEVEDKKFIKIAINVAHYHHEKWDGSGYPTGINGIGIPFEARIMALSDVFDALVSKRCYKDSFDYEHAFSIIEKSLGTHFDPELGKAFLECRPELEELYNGFVE